MNFVWQLLSQIPSADVALITAGPLIKAVSNYKQVRMRIIFNYRPNLENYVDVVINRKLTIFFGKVSKTLEEFDVKERPSSFLEEKFPSLTIIHSTVKSLHTQSHASHFYH